MASPRRAPILLVTSAALVALLVFAYAAAGWSEESVRITVRWTAKIAVVLFAAAFSASSLQNLFRNGLTRWLMVNRRRLGLGFALAHTVHLFALVVLGLAFPDPFVAGLDALTILGGGLAYVFMFVMAATSNDASVRWLGGRRWRLLHTVGGWYIWVVFAQSYGPRAVFDPSYLPFAALIVGVLGVRVARRIRARSRRLSGPAAA